VLAEVRTYTLVPGGAADFLAIYRELGLPVQRKHLGEPAGCYRSEVGELNRVTFIWRFENAADRERRRQQLLADKDFLAYFQDVRGLLVRQQSELLNEVDLA